MGRKRNQGKARRAAKAKAREEAIERENNNQAITNGQGQALSEQMRPQLHVQVGDKKCSHGYNPNESADFCFQFVKAFKESFDEGIRYGVPPLDVLLHAKSDTMDEFADVWNDAAKMEMGISFLLYAGTNAIIEREDRIAHDLATFARFFEQHIAVYLKQTQALHSWSKIDETFRVDEHTQVKFFWKRIPCSCLDEKYEEVKDIPKMGFCWNPQCSIPGRISERSKTKFCSRCRCVTYCSRECQEAHWTNHKSYCGHSAALIAKFDAKQQE